MSKLSDEIVAQSIDVQELVSHNIPIPREGDKLDIIYVDIKKSKMGAFIKTPKSSDKMTLLRYAQALGLPIDKTTYMNMFKTTGARIIVCCCYKDLDSDDGAKLDAQAMKLAKEKFNLEEEPTESI